MKSIRRAALAPLCVSIWQVSLQDGLHPGVTPDNIARLPRQTLHASSRSGLTNWAATLSRVYCMQASYRCHWLPLLRHWRRWLAPPSALARVT